MEKWKFRNLIKILLRCFIPAVIFFLCVLISEGGITEDVKNLFPLLYTMLGMLGIVFLLYIITNYNKKSNEINSKDYYRDIDNDMTPAMASLVIDNYIERNEVILATILDLYVKKYININKMNNKMIIKVLNKEVDELYLHEMYVIETIQNKELIDITKFTELVEQDCIESKLMKRDSQKNLGVRTLGKFALIALFICPLFMAIDSLSQVFTLIWGISLIVLLVILNFVLPVLSSSSRTTKGNIEANKLRKLKNYLRDYTLLKERDLDYINIVDRYLPFALALGEASKLEKLYIELIKL